MGGCAPEFFRTPIPLHVQSVGTSRPAGVAVLWDFLNLEIRMEHLLSEHVNCKIFDQEKRFDNMYSGKMI